MAMVKKCDNCDGTTNVRTVFLNIKAMNEDKPAVSYVIDLCEECIINQLVDPMEWKPYVGKKKKGGEK